MNASGFALMFSRSFRRWSAAGAVSLICAGCGTDNPELPRRSSNHLYELGETISFAAGGDSARFRTAGWSTPEQSGTWTDGPMATIVMRIPPPRRTLLLKIRMHGWRKPPEVQFQPVLVYVNDQSVASWQVGREGVFTAVVPREIAPGGGALTIDLHLPRAESGEGSDPRRLGVHCRDVTLSLAGERAGTRVYTPGEALRFGSGSEIERFLVHGWSEAEPDWQWTDGNSAALEFEMPASDRPLVLRAKMSGVAKEPELPFQPVDVFANGTQIARWEVGALAEFRAVIPAGTVNSRRTLALEFRIPRAISPKELGFGDDQRLLGLCWHEIEISPEL